VTAGSAPDLFTRAGEGLFSMLTDLDTLEERARRVVRAEGADLEELFIAYLGELLYLHHGEGFLLRRVEIRQGPDDRVEAEAFGEPFDPHRHRIEREIKAVTYHGVLVEEEDGTWRGRVILDI
jgi:SHS2 domain-containing protein